MYHGCVSPTWCYFYIDNELQALLTSWSQLAAVVKLNLAFYHAATAYMHRRQAIVRAHCDRSRVKPSATATLITGFWVRLGRTSAWWDNFVNRVVIPGKTVACSDWP